MNWWRVILVTLLGLLTARAELRVLTWNVGGNGLTNWSTNMPQVQAVGRIVKHLQPDLIAFQEVPNEGNGYLQLGNFTRTFLPGFTNVYSSGTDGFLRSAILSRFPIRRAQSHLDGVSLVNFGSSGQFARDLFEAEIDAPGFDTPLHLFTTHFKAGGDANSIAVRAAEAAAVSNFFVRTFFTLHPGRPFVLAGDLNENVAAPRNAALNPLPRLVNAGTTLGLVNALNPVTLSPNTWSARFGLSTRFDYLLASPILASNVSSAITFRTDRVNPLPSGVLRDDTATASDHLPVMVVIGEPTPIVFFITDVTESAGQVTLTWEADAGVGYRVERSLDFKSWVQASATRATNRVTLPAGTTTEFYRVLRVE